MKAQVIETKWWFVGLVSCAAVISMGLTFVAAGLEVGLRPLSFSRLLLMACSVYAFVRFYSFVLRWTLALFARTSAHQKSLSQ